jgi:hypothetical protein
VSWKSALAGIVLEDSSLLARHAGLEYSQLSLPRIVLSVHASMLHAVLWKSKLAWPRSSSRSPQPVKNETDGPLDAPLVRAATA